MRIRYILSFVFIVALGATSVRGDVELFDDFEGSGPFSHQGYCYQAEPHYPCPTIKNGKLNNNGWASGSLCLDRQDYIGKSLEIETVFTKEGETGGFSFHFDTRTDRHFAIHYRDRSDGKAECRYLAESGRFKTFPCGNALKPGQPANFRITLDDQRWSIRRAGVEILRKRTPQDMRLWDGLRQRTCLLLGTVSDKTNISLDYIKVSSD